MGGDDEAKGGFWSAFFAFLGTKHVWLSIVAVIVVLFGIASINEIIVAAERMAGALRGCP